jgi:hypothetical protein
VNLPGVLLINSANLQDEVWVVDGWEQYASIRMKCDSRPIYLRSELPHLKDKTPEEQRIIHAYKKAFSGEVIESRPWDEEMSKKIDIGNGNTDNRQHGQRRSEKSASTRRRHDGDSGGTSSLFAEH